MRLKNDSSGLCQNNRAVWILKPGLLAVVISPLHTGFFMRPLALCGGAIHTSVFQYVSSAESHKPSGNLMWTVWRCPGAVTSNRLEESLAAAIRPLSIKVSWDQIISAKTARHSPLVKANPFLIPLLLSNHTKRCTLSLSLSLADLEFCVWCFISFLTEHMHHGFCGCIIFVPFCIPGPLRKLTLHQ